jgi:hypothetical protein
LARCRDPQLKLPAWERDGTLLVNVGLRASQLPHAESILQQRPPQVMILAGLAGALDPALRVGDVVIDRPPGLPIPTVPGAREGSILASDELVSSPADKRRLHLDSGCLAVEMEGRRVSTLAARRAIPLLHIRAISDAADETLDPRFLALISPDGRPRIGRALGLIVGNPGALSALLRLQRSTTLALGRLGEALRQVATPDWPVPPSPRRTSALPYDESADMQQKPRGREKC